MVFSSRTPLTAILFLSFLVLSCFLANVLPWRLFPSKKLVVFVVGVPLILGAIFISPLYGLINSAILFSALSFSLLFIMTTERDAIVSALKFFGLPKQAAFSLAMSLYFLPVFEQKFNSVRVAQASRAHSSKNPIPLAVPFMHSVMKKAQGLSISLDARGFDPEKADVPYKLKMKALDWFALCALLVVVFLRIYYYLL